MALTPAERQRRRRAKLAGTPNKPTVERAVAGEGQDILAGGGSKPGERRGGRQKGTLNKPKTEGHGGQPEGAGRKPVTPRKPKPTIDVPMALVAILERLDRAVSALERVAQAIAPQTTTVPLAPERPRRKHLLREHASQLVLPEAGPLDATPPVIRMIDAIIAEDGVTPAEARRIQEREIVERADWRAPPEWIAARPD